MVKRLLSALWRRSRHYYLLSQARRQSGNALLRASGKTILVLCFGNIYRSPLVAHLLHTNIQQKGYTIRSAGFYPKRGRVCDGQYLEILKEQGYDLSAHRSSVVSAEDLRRADLIIIMDRKNWEEVLRLEPSALRKLIWIGAFNPSGPVEVEDPYNQDEEKTRKIIRQLEDNTEKLISKLCSS